MALPAVVGFVVNVISNAKIDPWMAAVPAAMATFLLFRLIQFDGWRDSFFGISVVAAPVGLVCGILVKLRRAPSYVRWTGLFLLEWFFTSFIISLLTR